MIPDEYVMEIIAPGLAYGFVIIDGRSIPLPGRFTMSAPGRWVNDVTGVEVVWRSGADA